MLQDETFEEKNREDKKKNKTNCLQYKNNRQRNAKSEMNQRVQALKRQKISSEGEMK